jgi:transcriptional regulator with XRE-family HTH domain
MKRGHLIKELRLKEGYSQRELSIKSGLSERTIQRIEKNEVVPNPHTLKVLGEIFEENFHQFEDQKKAVNNNREMKKIYILWNSIINFKINILEIFLKK